jgi:ferritin
VISQKLQNAINEQINSEFYAAHLYLSMAAFCDTRSLGGFSHWLKLQYSEELSHAMKLFDFITDRGGRVVLQAIRQPPVEFESVATVMRMALEHEQQVTASIDGLYELALEERDYSAHVLLEWFVDEQVEEEKSLTEIIDHLEMIGNDGTGLLLLDSRLGARTGAE